MTSHVEPEQTILQFYFNLSLSLSLLLGGELLPTEVAEEVLDCGLGVVLLHLVVDLVVQGEAVYVESLAVG